MVVHIGLATNCSAIILMLYASRSCRHLHVGNLVAGDLQGFVTCNQQTNLQAPTTAACIKHKNYGRTICSKAHVQNHNIATYSSRVRALTQAASASFLSGASNYASSVPISPSSYSPCGRAGSHHIQVVISLGRGRSVGHTSANSRKSTSRCM